MGSGLDAILMATWLVAVPSGGHYPWRVAPAEKNPHRLSAAAAGTMARGFVRGGHVTLIVPEPGGYRVVVRHTGHTSTVFVSNAGQVRPA